MKVRNRLDGRCYAIKRIPLNSTKKQLTKKITREVKLLSRLNHENVVRCLVSSLLIFLHITFLFNSNIFNMRKHQILCYPFRHVIHGIFCLLLTVICANVLFSVMLSHYFCVYVESAFMLLFGPFSL